MSAHIEKIVLATDFSDTSKDAGYHALLLAHTHNAKLKALHVFDTSAWNTPSHFYLTKEGYRLTENQEEIRQRGKDILKELAESFDIEVETIFTEGDPGHEIVRVVEEVNADLVVLGTHGYTGWKRFTLGSVAEFVVKYAPCDVFVTRPREKK